MENTYNHNGIEFTISDEILQDAFACYGIDLVEMTNSAIEKMKFSPDDLRPISEIAVSTPDLSQNECTFQINFKRN